MVRASVLVLAAGAVALAVTGCGRTLGEADYSDSYHDVAGPDGVNPAGPPPLRLHRPEGDVDLAAWTFCYRNGASQVCADGGPPEKLATTTAPGQVSFSFPLRGWDFRADFALSGGPRSCARVRSIAVPEDGDGTFTLPALGPAGSYDVTLSGNGGAGNDLATSFRWRTSTDSARPAPAGGVLGFMGPPMDPGDEIYASGPSLYLDGLAEEPGRASAVLVLPDAPGAPEYPMHLLKDPCPRDGFLSLEAADPTGEVDLPDLGDPPYRTEVRLTLDGVEYVGTGSWPDDLTPRNSNSLALDWVPALPAGL